MEKSLDNCSLLVLLAGSPVNEECNARLNIQQNIETQRLKLLRLVAGLLAVIAFVLLAPFSGEFRRWVSGYVSSVLSRAECAAQNLVIAQAVLLARRRGFKVDPARFFERLAWNDEPLPSLTHLRNRLKALRRILEDLPRYGARLLRRVMGDQRERVGREPNSEQKLLCPWRLAAHQIERPPDKDSGLCWSRYFPPSRMRAGGVGGWAM